ncbi:MAG: NifU family protein [Ignavibacteriaceae bacterium]|nr:NifU family protein [Ignavibacteriaceae bacterium]
MLMVQDVDLTPNPHALKFVLNEKLLLHEKRHYSNKEAAMDDPFAKGIFEIDGVVSVFYMDKFVSIEKSKTANWSMIQRPFINFLKSFDKQLLPPEKERVPGNDDSSAMLKEINKLIDERVRPALANDGGGLEVLGLDGNVVTIRYQGACGSCPSSISATLTAIAGLLKRDIDPSIEVIAG